MQNEDLEKNTIKTILFDFDGTLCDSFAVFRKAFSIVAKEFGLNQSILDSSKLRDLSTREVLEQLGVNIWQLPKITRRGREEMFQLRNELRLFPGVEEVLKQLISDDIKVGILTSNSKSLVSSLLSADILDKIDLLKPSPMFGKSKALNNYVKKNNLKKIEVGYVGDETRDIDAASKSKVQSIAVTYGYNTETALKKSRPNLVFHKITDVLTLY